jgi:surface antigen
LARDQVVSLPGQAGALLGAFLGNQIGLSLDRADQLAMQKTTNLALGKKQIWDSCCVA